MTAGPPPEKRVIEDLGIAESSRLRPEDHSRGTNGAAVMLIEQHGSRILFVFRNYPLEQLHPEALIAAEAAGSAAAQGRFWEMHRLLFANQQHLHRADLDRYAQQTGLDMDRFHTDMNTHVHEPRIRADIALGQAANVRSTPGFFINGRVQDVSFGMQALHDAVLAALR